MTCFLRIPKLIKYNIVPYNMNYKQNRNSVIQSILDIFTTLLQIASEKNANKALNRKAEYSNSINFSEDVVLIQY